MPILCYPQAKPYQIVLTGSDTSALIPIEDYRPLVYAVVKERECRVAVRHVREENESYIREKDHLRTALEKAASADQQSRIALAQSDTIQTNQGKIIIGVKEENKKLRKENRILKLGGAALVVTKIVLWLL